MPTADEFRFRTIYILESLPADERPTGQDLKEELARLSADQSWFPTVKLLPSYDRATFEAHLRAIAGETKARDSGPLLQIETHGAQDQTGLRLASGEVITWPELKPFLQEVNVPTGMNLLVLMSSCYGSWLFGAIDAGDRAPFWAMIGPDRQLSPEVLLASWTEFYRVLFAASDGAVAWRAMNELERPKPVTFAFFSAIAAFQLVLYGYFKQYGNPRGMERRVARLAMQWHLFGPPIPPPPFAKWMGAHQWQFAKYWRQFFLIDLYPANASRFSLSYEACRAHPGPLGRIGAV